MRARCLLASASIAAALIASQSEANAEPMDPALERLVLNPGCHMLPSPSGAASNYGTWNPAGGAGSDGRCRPDNVAFKRLINQYGAALAPTALHNARTTGYGGFELALAGSFTSIDHSSDYMQNGPRGTIDPSTNRRSIRNNGPDPLAQVYYLKARKGFPFGLEITGLIGTMSHTSFTLIGSDVRLSVLEGFRQGFFGVLPDLAVGGGVLDGDHLLLVPLVAFSTLCAQTHVPYLALCVALCVVAFGAVGWRWWRARAIERRARTSVLVAVALGAVLWLPVLVDQVRRTPGNITMLRRRFLSPPEPPVGLAVGVFGAFLMEHLDDTVRTSEDIKRYLDLPVLGQIPALSDGYRLVREMHPKSPVAEAYRTLRSNVSFVSIDDPIRTLVITSASVSEGKSMTAANLALTMALDGKDVLLVDTDLRHPTQHELFGLDGEAGFTDVLTGKMSLADATVTIPGTTLSVVPCGGLPPNPSELLASEKMGEVVGEMISRYDMVIFDTPPCTLVAAAVILAALSLIHI